MLIARIKFCPLNADFNSLHILLWYVEMMIPFINNPFHPTSLRINLNQHLHLNYKPKINFVNRYTINSTESSPLDPCTTHTQHWGLKNGKKKPGSHKAYYNPIGLLPLPTQNISKSAHKITSLCAKHTINGKAQRGKSSPMIMASSKVLPPLLIIILNKHSIIHIQLYSIHTKNWGCNYNSELAISAYENKSNS